MFDVKLSVTLRRYTFKSSVSLLCDDVSCCLNSPVDLTFKVLPEQLVCLSVYLSFLKKGNLFKSSWIDRQSNNSPSLLSISTDKAHSQGDSGAAFRACWATVHGFHCLFPGGDQLDGLGEEQLKMAVFQCTSVKYSWPGTSAVTKVKLDCGIEYMQTNCQ